MHSNVWSVASEANLREQVIVSDDGSIKLRSPPGAGAAIMKDQAAGKWSITKIPVPALLIFAHNPLSDLLSGVTLDEGAVAEIKKASDELENARRRQMDAFRRDAPKSRILELDHTDHRCFIQRRGEVVREMNRFLR